MATVTKQDPFKVKKTTTTKSKVAGVDAGSEVSAAVDTMVQLQAQIKNLEGQVSELKAKVSEAGYTAYTTRAMTGMVESSVRLQGQSSYANFTVSDASNLLSEDDKANVAEKWGEEAAEALVLRSYSIKFDESVLAANYDVVVKALMTLPENVLENLFKPEPLKAAPLADIRKHAKDAADLESLMKVLRIKTSVAAK
jgi:hypothetical protein